MEPTVLSPHLLTLDTETEEFISTLSDLHNSKSTVHHEVAPDLLKRVYKRGARDVSSAPRISSARDDSARRRLHAYMHVVRTGQSANSAYVHDYDLLPSTHPLSTGVITAAITTADLTVVIKNREEYKNPEEAILDLTEYSGYGYKAEAAIRASWLRGIRAGEDPFFRASLLAAYGVNSLDRDLLPKNAGGDS